MKNTDFFFISFIICLVRFSRYDKTYFYEYAKQNLVASILAQNSLKVNITASKLENGIIIFIKLCTSFTSLLTGIR